MNKKWVYLAGFGFIIIAMIIAGILLTTQARHEVVQTQSDIRNISVSVLAPPKISLAGYMMDVSYTLEMSRLKDKELTLSKVEVLNKKTEEVLSVIEQESLMQDYTPEDDMHNPSISISLQVNQQSFPEVIMHRLYFISDGRAILPFSVTGGEIQIEG